MQSHYACIEGSEYVRKAEVDNEHKETRLQGLKGRLAVSDDSEADVLHQKIERLEQEEVLVHRFSLGDETVILIVVLTLVAPDDSHGCPIISVGREAILPVRWVTPVFRRGLERQSMVSGWERSKNDH